MLITELKKETINKAINCLIFVRRDIMEEKNKGLLKDILSYVLIILAVVVIRVFIFDPVALFVLVVGVGFG